MERGSSAAIYLQFEFLIGQCANFGKQGAPCLVCFWRTSRLLERSFYDVWRRQSSSTPTKMPKPKPYHHNVYVVELSKDVLLEPRFKRANPDYRPPLPCVYVGMTGLSPDERFDKHKAGIKSNKFVRLNGLRLLPNLYQFYNPMPYEGARDMEVELAIALREQGYGVWQA